MLRVLGLVVGGVLRSKAWGEVMLVLGLGMGLFVLKTRDAGVVETSELFEMDSLRSSLVLLRIWVVTLAILGRSKIKAMGSESGLFIGVGVFLLFFLMLRFGLRGYLLFYMRFESCLVPILLMILG